MKVLWITNIVLPPPCSELGLPQSRMGGWMYSLLTALLTKRDVKFAVASTYSGGQFKRLELGNVIYYLLPGKRSNVNYNVKLEKIWQNINKEFCPDLVHLHGTEYSHGLSFLRSCPNVNSVVSIQGLISVCSTSFYYAGMSRLLIFRSISLRDILKFDTLFHSKYKLAKSGVSEVEIIQKVNHIIGRTTWDKAHTRIINPIAKYHFCNEILRPDFYNYTWKYIYCQRHNIFLSQGGYPLKGLHQVLQAVFLLKKKYLDISITVAGPDITASSSIKEKLKICGYGLYLKKQIKKLGLENNIRFVGVLNEEQMINEYLNAHLFICPSSIENSPNSLGEAQILGTPVVASYVGGVPDMIEEGFSGLMYRFEEVEMLVFAIDRIFSMSENEISMLSVNARTTARRRHNKADISQKMMNIYSEILSLQ